MSNKTILLLLVIFVTIGFLPAQSRWLSSDIRLDTSAAGVNNSQDPQTCCAGNQVYIVWADDRNGNWDIYFNYSINRGATWQFSDIRLDTDIAGAAGSVDPMICCSGNQVYVVWTDSRNGVDSDIYFNYSSDGGTNWQFSDIRLDTNAPGSGESSDSQICCAGNRVYVTWRDQRGGHSDIYFNYSSDGGGSWQDSDIRLDVGILNDDSYWPQISCVDNRVYVVWGDQKNGFRTDIYFNYSSNGGISWQDSDIRLDTDPAGAENSFEPQICCIGNRVYVSWYDYRNSFPDIYFNYSSDGGGSWQASDIRLDTDPAGANCSEVSQICCLENRVYVVWSDSRNGSWRNWDIYFNYSNNGGITWQASDIRLDTDSAGDGHADEPQLCVYGNRVYVTWEDKRDGNMDTYFNYSTDGGASWLSSDIRLNTNSPDVSDSYMPQICCNGEQVNVAWYDNRNGSEDIYFNTTNELPTAKAGPDRSVFCKDQVHLDGSGSSDPDGDQINFQWQFLSRPVGSAAILNQVASAGPWFQADKIGQYEIQLRVRDPFGENDYDAVIITSQNNIYPPLNPKGKQVTNRSLAKIEYINVITWENNAKNDDAQGYRIYLLNGSKILLSEVNTNTLSYWHRKLNKGVVYKYALVTINSDGQESGAVMLTVQ